MPITRPMLDAEAARLTDLLRNAGEAYTITLGPPNPAATVAGTPAVQQMATLLNYYAERAGLSDRALITPLKPPVLSITPQVAAFGTTLTATFGGDLLPDDVFDPGNGDTPTPIVAGTPVTFTLPSSGPYTAHIVNAGQTRAEVKLTATTPVIGVTWRDRESVSVPGAYTLSHQSVDDPTKAAFEITRAGTYVIDGGEVQSKGIGIKCRVPGVRLTIRNVKGTGLNPNVRGRAQDRFIDIQGAASALIEHVESEGFTGIYFLGYKGNGTTDTFIVQNSKAVNINGQFSDGNGGYLDGDNQFFRGQFVQFNAVKGIPGARIRKSLVQNAPRLSHVEDVVNLYGSSGNSDSDRIIVEDLLIDGAYAFRPDGSYSGGGVMLGDGGGSNLESRRVIVLEASNYGLAVAGGSNIRHRDFLVLGRGVLDDGTFLDRESDAGLYARPYSGPLVNVEFRDGTVGWGTPVPSKPNNRWDTDVKPPAQLVNVTKEPAGPITEARKQQGRDLFATRMAGEVIGRLS